MAEKEKPVKVIVPSLAEKLLAFQRLGIKVEKDGKNPHFGNTYPTLNEVLDKVKKPLNDLGIVIMQTIQLDGLHTVLLDTQTNQELKSVIEFVQKGDAQKLGSNITYNRRYALVTMLGLEAEDDDATSAVSDGSNAVTRNESLPVIRR